VAGFRLADARRMKLADRSPGSVVAIAAVVLCTQILIEIGMWMVASTAALVFAMVTAIAFTVFIITWFSSLLGEDELPEARAAVTPAPEPVPVAAPTRSAPSFRPVLH
jgi:hypothetical protein